MKLDFYVALSDTTICSDHLPLKKFLQRNTPSTKVNNWAVKLELYNLSLQWLSGKSNVLGDTLCRLIKIDPDVTLIPEPAGQEFGYSLFEPLEPATTIEKSSTAEAAAIDIASTARYNYQTSVNQPTLVTS